MSSTPFLARFFEVASPDVAPSSFGTKTLTEVRRESDGSDSDRIDYGVRPNADLHTLTHTAGREDSDTDYDPPIRSGTSTHTRAKEETDSDAILTVSLGTSTFTKAREDADSEVGGPAYRSLWEPSVL